MISASQPTASLHILKRIVLSYLVFIAMVMIFNRNNNDRLTSFLVVNMAAVAGMYILGMRTKKVLGFSMMQVIFIGYAVKLIIGYLFWEFYMFPGYFTNPGSHIRFNHLEYLFTDWLMKDIATQRLSSGFFYLSPLMMNVKHLKIHYVMSNLYMSGSYHPWDIAVQNTLFSTYSAVLVLAISRRLGATVKQMKYILIFAVYQPFSMISSIIWRDVVGQFFVALGGYFTLRSLHSKFYIAIPLLILASFSMIMQRDIYFFFPVLAYTSFIILQSKNKYLLLIIPLLFAVILYANFLFELAEGLKTSYGENLTINALGLFLPINIIRIFVGPFPWTQWFKFNDSTIFQVADYFQSVISITLVILAVSAFTRKKISDPEAYSGLLLLFMLFVPFVFATLGTVDVHQPYMTTGIIFLVPVMIFAHSPRKYMGYNLLILVFFLIANVVWLVTGLAGTGVGSTFR